MLKKTRKLNLSWIENQQFFREFLIYRGTYSTIYFRDLPKQKNSRLTVVVGRKVSLSAVERNRVKRQVYLLIEKTSLAKLNKDIVVVINKTTSQENYLSDLEKFTKSF